LCRCCQRSIPRPAGFPKGCTKPVERFGWNPRRRQLLDGIGDALDPVLLDLSAGRAAQKARFSGQLFPNVVEAECCLTFAEFLQNEARHRAQGNHRDSDRRQ